MEHKNHSGIYHKTFLATGVVTDQKIGGDSIPYYWIDAPHWQPDSKVITEKFGWLKYSAHQKSTSYVIGHNIYLINEDTNRHSCDLPSGVKTFPHDNYTYWRNCARSSLLRLGDHRFHNELVHHWISLLDTDEPVPTHWTKEIEKRQKGMVDETRKFRLAMHYSRVQYGLITMKDLPIQTQKWLFRIKTLKHQVKVHPHNRLLIEQCVTGYFEDAIKLVHLLMDRTVLKDLQSSMKLEVYNDFIHYYLTEVVTNSMDLSVDYEASSIFSRAFLDDEYTYFKPQHNLCPLKRLTPLCKPGLFPNVTKHFRKTSIYSTSPQDDRVTVRLID
ncbi:hypothetical protein [Moritella sp. F3]|uniref:hypothetical protein n=1 Tax=Moritella sp. F3 TaxID=2718882 RepID=UPI0018E0F20B|nr:hypothetical protein [Moritella sp. F3]GIC77100.1 hypothetical protein FMO001_18270 [Moritella sp. F1]GIC82219.1 hypothetical protein FMO003_25000 [Moritella sp. F3]